MNILKYLKRRPKATAAVAKERLQIIISHERTRQDSPDYLPMLQQDLIAVISKYVAVDAEDVKVAVDRSGDSAVLELNISLSEERATSQEDTLAETPETTAQDDSAPAKTEVKTEDTAELVVEREEECV